MARPAAGRDAALFEAMRLLADPVAYGRGVQHGDGRAVERAEQLCVGSTRRRAAASRSSGTAVATSRARPPRGAPSWSRTAISMGADLHGLLGIITPTRATLAVARRGLDLTRRIRDSDYVRAQCRCAFVRDYTAPFPVDRVRLISIYSKGDGVVRWERGRRGGRLRRVAGSHVGLMANRKAYRAIAAALAGPELA